MTTYAPSLPVELLSSILEQVEGESKSTLVNAALCSHQFYDIATPILYRRVDVGGREDDGTGKDLRKLLLHFLKHPDLAKQVQHFSIRPAIQDNWNSSRNEASKDSLSAALDQAKDLEDDVKDAIAQASHSEKEHAQWLGEIDFEDAVLALLIPRFVNLQTLDLEVSISPDYIVRMLERVARKERPFDKEPTLSHLHSVTWIYDDEKYGGSLTGVVFMLPSVQSIYVHRIGSGDDDDAQESLANVENRSSSCTQLEARDCKFNDGDIKAILTIPKKLTTFIYEMGWGHISYCSVSFKVLRDALEIHQETLENLSIDYGHDGIDWTEDMDTTPPMASFKDFSKLRQLRIAPDYVFGTNYRPNDHPEQYLLDLLPPTLELLHIRHGDEFGLMQDGSIVDSSVQWQLLYKAIHIVLSSRQIALPSLRKIILDTSLERIKEFGDQMAELLNLAKSSNTEFILQNNFGDEKYKRYDERKERKWGMDEDIEWKPCTALCNIIPPYEIVDLQH